MPALQRKIEAKKPAVDIKILAAIIAVVILAGIISTLLYIRVFSFKNIYPGVNVCGVDVGNLTVQQAQEKIKKTFNDKLYNGTITIKYKDKEKKLELSDKYTLDAKTTAENAFNLGKSTGVVNKIFGLKANIDVPLVIKEKKELVNASLLQFALELEKNNNLFKISNDYKKVTVDLTNDNAFLMDIDKTDKEIYKNICNANFSPVTFSVKEDITADDVDIIYNRIQRPPVDASVEVVNNQAIIKPHQLGIVIDKNELLKNLKAGKKVFDLPITTVMPKITTEHYAAQLFADLLGSQTSNYNTSLVGRSNNLVLAAKAINGVIIAPGKTFSFNETVGERSYSRGFMDAIVFTSGGMEDGVGGGICQVSSTLYCAQLYADLETLSRKNHQYAITYVPNGQDATVVYGSLDYKFRNNTEYPIKIIANVGGGSLTVKIMGVKTDKSKKITIENKTISTSSFSTTEVTTDKLAVGQTNVKQKGQNGLTVDSYKVYWKDGVVQKREFLHRSVYNPMNRIVEKGIASVKEETASTQNNESTHQEITPSPKPAVTPPPAPSSNPQPPSPDSDNSYETSESGI